MKNVNLAGIVQGKEEEDAVLIVLRSGCHAGGKEYTFFGLWCII